MSLVSLVIAPFIAVSAGDGNVNPSCGMTSAECCKKIDVKKDCCAYGSEKSCQADMSKVMSMSKEECAAYCDSIGCSPEQKEMCLKHAGMGMEAEGTETDVEENDEIDSTSTE